MVSPQVHCEDHRRHDVVVPYGHHQSLHVQPVPRCPHLQTEECQQAGADPPQRAATPQVRIPQNALVKDRLELEGNGLCVTGG